jgi:SAM-dependent methyltransferase
MKLNLGCGRNKREGYVNIDRREAVQPDLVWDLDVTPYPFEDDSVEEIVAHNILQRIGQDTDGFLAIVRELHRVLMPGGTLDILAPHHRSDLFWDDPTNVRPINQGVFGLFSKATCAQLAERGVAYTPLAVDLDIDLEIVSVTNALHGEWSRRFADGELTQQETEAAVATHANVVEWIALVVRKVPAVVN